MSHQPSAAMLVIGNEILSGKTRDANVQFIGESLANMGIVLAEARVIRDDHQTIIAAVRDYSHKYDYVFTTGGIGPTHDDITAAAVAAAFATDLEIHPAAAELIGGDPDHPRMKMAQIPVGAALIENSVSRAPGFQIENVFVLAGVPSIAQAMFAALSARLQRGQAIVSANADVFMKESDIAVPLTSIASANDDVEIGSYPFSRDGTYGANLVVRGTDADRVDAVMNEVVSAMSALGGEVVRRA